MRYRIFIMSLEDHSTNTLTVFAPIEPGTIIEWGTDSQFNLAKHCVLTCAAVPDYF